MVRRRTPWLPFAHLGPPTSCSDGLDAGKKAGGRGTRFRCRTGCVTARRRPWLRDYYPNIFALLANVRPLALDLASHPAADSFRCHLHSCGGHSPCRIPSAAMAAQESPSLSADAGAAV